MHKTTDVTATNLQPKDFRFPTWCISLVPETDINKNIKNVLRILNMTLNTEK